ncbi:signal peptidase I [Glaciihabitans tibetensis]|uniref:Signal peptidase I n=1 Tax=Glaciihabitans tibetensis TaxID=1266600 RepID=A0A2T0VCE1_9MICO|nr:signal peptidase I [Glaciihabitans tibetensis]PRY67847.1 signal peptidase I [Glaciihabitans tibetensis]
MTPRFALPVWPRVILLALIALVVVTPVALPSVTGTRWIVVDGGSMEPTFAVGDIVMVAPLNARPLEVGEVVTVRRRDGQLYTHRITEIASAGAMTTRGDANTFNDRDPVSPADIAGRVTGVLTGAPAAVVRASGELPLRLALALGVLALFVLPVRKLESIPIGVAASSA